MVYFVLKVRLNPNQPLTASRCWVVPFYFCNSIVIWWRGIVGLQREVWRASTPSLERRNCERRWNAGKSRCCCRQVFRSSGSTVQCSKQALLGLDHHCMRTVASVGVRVMANTCYCVTLVTVDTICTAWSRPSRLVYRYFCVFRLSLLAFVFRSASCLRCDNFHVCDWFLSWTYWFSVLASRLCSKLISMVLILKLVSNWSCTPVLKVKDVIHWAKLSTVGLCACGTGLAVLPPCSQNRTLLYCYASVVILFGDSIFTIYWLCLSC